MNSYIRVGEVRWSINLGSLLVFFKLFFELFGFIWFLLLVFFIFCEIIMLVIFNFVDFLLIFLVFVEMKNFVMKFKELNLCNINMIF